MHKARVPHVDDCLDVEACNRTEAGLTLVWATAQVVIEDLGAL